ncbi:ribbon-helix-helix domain-containing protein [soil metagenome]
MIRTQIYITNQEGVALTQLIKQTSRSQNELIRAAIDKFCEKQTSLRTKGALQQAAGMWQNRHDLPDFGFLRNKLNRFSEITHDIQQRTQ